MNVRTVMALLWTALATVAWADADSDLQTLERQRDTLLKELALRRAAMQPGDGVYVLRLDGAVEGFDVKLSLPRYGGTWREGTASVPWWQQETQKEKFSFLHRNGSQSMHREKFTFPAKAEKLELAGASASEAGGQLRATVKVTYRLDLPARLRMPPGGAHLYTTDGRWSLLDQWYVGSRTIDRAQQLRLSGEVSETVRYVEVVLAGGIDGRALHLRCLVPYEPFSAVEVIAPQWNAGRHEADVTGLKYADGKLTGQLRVKFNPDAWFPKNAWYAVYDLDVDCRLGRATGRYSATISEGDFVKVTGQNKSGNRPSREGPADFTGEVTGIAARALTGQYTTEGELGERRGLLRGGLLPYQSDPSKLLTKPAGSPAQQATTLYNQIRALRRVLDRPGTPLEEALAQAERPAPTWAAQSDSGQAAYVRDVARLAKIAEDAADVPTHHGWPAATNPRFGPYYRTNELSADGGVARLPGPIEAEGPQVWQTLSGWRVLGPFPQPACPAGRVADVIYSPGASYEASVERLGDHYKGPDRLTWQPVKSAEDGKLTPPGWTWSKRGKVTEPGRADTFWYAACTLASPAEQSVWLAVEARDNAALWVNGLLAWQGSERQKNYQQPGPAIIKVRLTKGENRLLLRVRDDRAESFARVRVCTQGAGAADRTSAPLAQQGGKVDAADPASPPIAWDLSDGTNVAWSTDVAGADGTPLAADGKLYVSASPHHLVCLDARTGKPLWRSAANVLELISPENAKALESADADQARSLLAKHLGKDLLKGGIDLSAPVSDGANIYLHVGTGVLACFDADGKRLWMARTHMPSASVTLIGKTVVLEGPASDAWAEAFHVDAKGLSDRKQGKAGHNYGASENHTLRRLADLHSGKRHAMLGLHAATGEVAWKATPRGTYAGAPMVLAVLDGKGNPHPVLLSRGAAVYAPDGTCLREDVDLGLWDWLAATSHGHRAFSAWEGGRGGAEFWIDEAGLGYRLIWRATRLHAYVAGGANDGLADGSQFYVWRRVWEHAKHCPAYALELDTFDADTGRRTGQIKPAVRHTNRAVPPVKVGELLYLGDHRGGPHSGGEPHERQVTVTSAGPDPVLLARNPTPNVSAGPVPAGDGSLVFRCGQSVVCVRVDGKDGQAYQERTIARHVLERIYRTPAGTDVPKIVPSDKLPPAGSPLTVLRNGQNLIDWLVAGPLPESSPPTTDLDKPFRPGDVFSAGIHTAKFRPLPGELVSVQTSFHNDGRLDDWQVRRVTGRIDLSTLPAKGSSVHYLACTLLQPRDGLAMFTTDAKGLTAILGGTPLQAGQPIELAQGTYPLVLRVDPSQFKRRQPLGPTDVAAAMKGGAAKAIDWPGTWTVFGPMGPAAGMPEPAQLKRLGTSWTLGGSEYRAVSVGSIGPSLDLTRIVGLAPGEAPEVGKQVQEKMVNQQLTAWALTEIEVPADGTLIVNASADWFMEWYVDGERVYSTLSGGNKRAPTQLTAHSFAVPLSKGKHAVAVRSKPGSKGWSVTSLGAFVPGELSVARALHEKYPAKGGVTAAEPEWRVAVTFAQMDRPADVAAVRTRQVDRARAWLERIAEKLPGTNEGDRAKSLLRSSSAD